MREIIGEEITLSEEKEKLNELRRIFKDFESNLKERTSCGKLTFAEIYKQMEGVRDDYRRLLDSLEIEDKEKGKFEVELEEMNEILRQANITDKAE